MEMLQSMKESMPGWGLNYEKVSHGEDDESSLGEETKASTERRDSLYPDTPHAFWHSYRTKAIRLHGFFISLYILIAVIAVWLSRHPTDRVSRLNHSPATNLLRTSTKKYNATEDPSSYIQKPSPENDERWKQLTLGNFIRLSPEDLKKVGREKDAVYLEDGSGIGLINAHHEVHCVMSLYHYSHPEYYWPNATVEQQEANRHHYDHCLDYLLQAAMCHGDVGYMTYHWYQDEPRPYWKPAEHTCVNWDALRQWMRERKVPIHDPGFLVHPTLGVPAYPNGVQSIPTIHDTP